MKPHVGDEIRVKVFHLSDRTNDQLPANVTYDGKFKVDFAASIRLICPDGNPWYDPNAYQIGDVFTGRLEEVQPFGCWLRHPRGADAGLLVDGVQLGFEPGQQIKVMIVAVNPQKRSLEVVLCTPNQA